MYCFAAHHVIGASFCGERLSAPHDCAHSLNLSATMVNTQLHSKTVVQAFDQQWAQALRIIYSACATIASPTQRPRQHLTSCLQLGRRGHFELRSMRLSGLSRSCSNQQRLGPTFDRHYLSCACESMMPWLGSAWEQQGGRAERVGLIQNWRCTF